MGKIIYEELMSGKDELGQFMWIRFMLSSGCRALRSPLKGTAVLREGGGTPLETYVLLLGKWGEGSEAFLYRLTISFLKCSEPEVFEMLRFSRF